MHAWHTRLATVIGVGGIAALLVATGGREAMANGVKLLHVLIVNDSAHPVPVAGHVSLDESQREVFSQLVTVGFGGSNGGCNVAQPIDVPAGKRLVVEHVSATSALPPSAKLADVSLVSHETGMPRGYAPATDAGVATLPNGTYNFANVSQPMRIYTDTSLRACVRSTAIVPDGYSVFVIVSGYLVTL